MHFFVAQLRASGGGNGGGNGGAAGLSVVIDTLRASTTIAVALDHGAVEIIPVLEPDDARRRALEIGPATLLAGERSAVPPAGFHLGNSPREYTRERVAGKTIVLTTTNGTKALLAAVPNSRDVLIGSYVNFTVTLAAVRSALRQGVDVDIVCAGSEGKFSLEDTACAGRFVRFAMRRPGKAGAPELNDAARAALRIEKHYGDDIARLFDDAEHGRTLRNAGFGDDLIACAAIDAHPVVAAYEDGVIRKREPKAVRGTAR
jgi:2-phosphosulfolactate phosphatase